MTFDRAATARHEAGHVAAAVVCGRLPARVTADWPATDQAGLMVFGWGDYSRASLLDRVLIVLMGPMAEVTPGWPPEWPIDPTAPPPPAQGDARMLVALVDHIDLDEPGYYALVREANLLAKSRVFKDMLALITAALMMADETTAEDLAWLLGPDRRRRYGLDRKEGTCST
jgi:hypothetical protein